MQGKHTVTRREQEHDLPAKEIRFRVTTDVDEIIRCEADWERLVSMAIEPNIFFESGQLIPAVRRLSESRGFAFAVMDAPKRRNPDGTRVLCGLFPLKWHPGKKALSIWTHDYAFVGTPLIRKDCCTDAVRSMLNWFASKRLWAWQFPSIHVGGAFHRHLWSEIQRRRLPFWMQRQEMRAAFRSADDFESYRQRALSRSTRSEIQRCENRIRANGSLTSRRLENEAELDDWIETFLVMEASGWKGRRGTALNSTTSHAAFFRDIAASAFRKDRLIMFQLLLDNRPIAMNSAFLAQDGAYYFKIAHDEEYGKFSPGYVLELEFSKWLHDHPEIKWIDSCAAPDHPMIDRVWDDRRTVQTYWIGSAGVGGTGALSALSLAHQLRTLIKRRKRNVVAS